MSVSYPKEIIRKLIERTLPWEDLKRIMSSFKDSDRFEKYIEVLQEKTGWKEKIVLPLTEHLMIVSKDGKLIVKALCGCEFGDYRENWKLKALIYVRNKVEQFKEIYPDPLYPDANWCEIREFICPGCGALLDVEAVPPGYPVINEFEPDIETFYTKWLKKPIPK
ncbi:MAG: acetone carboxylase subunit gamma [Candidatus Bathyarchaeia archaeon]